MNQQMAVVIVFFGTIVLAIFGIGFAIGRFTAEEKFVMIRICEER